MIKKIIKFIKYIRSDLSKSFLFSQAAFDEIMIDKIYSFFNCKTRNFNIILNKENDKNFENEKIKISNFFEENKSERVKFFSSGLELNFIPDIFFRIVQKHKNEINDYLGNKILAEKPLFFRNYNFDKRFSGFDVYSNVWHQDSHDGNRLLKIFVLVEDVEKKDGPLMWLDEQNTRSNWDELCDRWNFNAFKEVKSFENQNLFIGKAGTYSILDTSRCMHRASIPEVKRDILVLTLYPNWRSRTDRNELRF